MSGEVVPVSQDTVPKSFTRPPDSPEVVAPVATGAAWLLGPRRRVTFWVKPAVGTVLAVGLVTGFFLKRESHSVVSAPAARSTSAPAAVAPPSFPEPIDSSPVVLAAGLPPARPVADAGARATTKRHKGTRSRLRKVALAAGAPNQGPGEGPPSAIAGAEPAEPAEKTAPVAQPFIEEGPYLGGPGYLAGRPAKATDRGLRAGSDVRFHGEETNAGCRVTLGSRPEARIFIDGINVGVTPLLDLRVPCGRRTIVWKSLTDERSQQVVVQPGPTVRRWVTFQ